VFQVARPHSRDNEKCGFYRPFIARANIADNSYPGNSAASKAI
jgi:hypothetical protein